MKDCVRAMPPRLFAEAEEALGPREVSDVVETPFGFHVILHVE